MSMFRLSTPSTVAPTRFTPHRPVPGHAGVRRIAAVLSLAACGLLAGCANLQAVSATTASAGAVVADTSAAARWQQSEPRLRALGLPGDSDQVCALGRSGRAPQAEFDAAFTEIAAVHRLLGDYFQALGLLASDRLPLPSAALAGVPVSSAEEAARKSLATLLGRALDGYRQRELRHLIELAHADVDTSLVLLQRLAALYVDEIDGERRQIGRAHV